MGPTTREARCSPVTFFHNKRNKDVSNHLKYNIFGITRHSYCGTARSFAIINSAARHQQSTNACNGYGNRSYATDRRNASDSGTDKNSSSRTGEVKEPMDFDSQPKTAVIRGNATLLEYEEEEAMQARVRKLYADAPEPITYSPTRDQIINKPFND